MHPLFFVLLLCNRYGCNDAGRYVLSPDNWFLDVCMYGALKVVIMMWSGYHRKFTVLLPLLVLFKNFFDLFLDYVIHCVSCC